MESKWREILEQVERGELTPEAGAERMARSARSLNVAELSEGAAPPPEQPQAAAEPEVVEDFESLYATWNSWWVLPLSLGAFVFVGGAVLIAWANQSGQAVWLFCGVLPLLLGALIMLLSFWSRTSRWLHVRVREPAENGSKRPKRVAISLPIPTQLIGWGLKTFGARIPGLREQPQVYEAMPEILRSLDKSGDPLIVEVNERDGTEVRVYII